MPPTLSTRWRVVAAAAVLQLCAALVAVAVVDAPTTIDPVGATRGRAAPQEGDGVERAAELARAAEVSALLAARSAAVLGRDRKGFLATVDPTAGPFFERQAALFDALAEVPIGTWDYDLEPLSGRPAEAALDGEYGPRQWWAPSVVLRHALAGFDEQPSDDVHHLTFVRRGGRWLLGADDDFASVGATTQRALWDGGPVTAVRSGGVLVLGRGDRRLLEQMAAGTAAAVQRATAIWGDGWSQRVVVLVPSTSEELISLLDEPQDLSRIAAVATAEPAGARETTDRVLVNPQNFGTLGELGRQVVLTHEVTHVATRAATGPAVPAWLAEGFADHVAYRGLDVPLASSAADLRQDVRAGRIPASLPTDAAFDGGNPGLAQAYQQAWLAVRLLVEQCGEPGLLAVYRAVGASRELEGQSALAGALSQVCGTDPARLTADWQADLQRLLG